MSFRSIVIFRHGEAENVSALGSDHGRKLNKAGISQVERVSKKLSDLGFTPNFVYSSDAVRATETLDIYKSHIDSSTKIVYDRKLYNATEEIFFDCLYQLDDSVSGVVFIGHNPTWSMLSSNLANDYLSMSPANAVVLEADLDSWGDASTSWTLKAHLKP